MDTREYRMHKGARVALNVVGVLCILLIIAAPLGLYILFRISKAKLTVDNQGLTATSITTVKINFSEVDRVGIVKVPIVAGGVGGALARAKVGGKESTNICVLLNNKKKQMFIVSMYENHEEATAQVQKALGKPLEQLSTGMWGVKWPERQLA